MSKKRIRAVRFGSHTLGWRWELPDTAEAYEQMVEQASDRLHDLDWITADTHDVAKCVLRAIGITPQRKAANDSRPLS